MWLILSLISSQETVASGTINTNMCEVFKEVGVVQKIHVICLEL